MKIRLSLCLAAGTLLVLSDAVVGQKVLRSRSVANATQIPLNAPYRRLLAGESTTVRPSNPGATAAATESAAATANVENEDDDGFTVVDGAVYLLRGGKRAGKIEGDVVLRISPNGIVTGFDGKMYRIPSGEMLRMDGQLASLPGNSAEAAPEAPAPAPPPENPTKRGGPSAQSKAPGR